MQLFSPTSAQTTDATSEPRGCDSGAWCFSAAGVFGGATVTAQISLSGGPWMPIPAGLLHLGSTTAAFTAASAIVFATPDGAQVRAVVSGAGGTTAVFASLDRVQALPQRVRERNT